MLNPQSFKRRRDQFRTGVVRDVGAKFEGGRRGPATFGGAVGRPFLIRPIAIGWSGIVPVMANRRTRSGAKTRKIGTLAEAAAASLLPVDPELFLWCQGVYYAAATMAMPVQNPEYTRIPLNEKGGFVLKDMPINRGMLAVAKELRERKASEETKMAMMTRLMHFGDILREPALAPFIKRTGDSDALSVSEALIKACATAKLVTINERIRFDIDDLARIAQQLTDEEEVAEKAAKSAE